MKRRDAIVGTIGSVLGFFGLSRKSEAVEKNTIVTLPMSELAPSFKLNEPPPAVKFWKTDGKQYSAHVEPETFLMFEANGDIIFKGRKLGNDKEVICRLKEMMGFDKRDKWIVNHEREEEVWTDAVFTIVDQMGTEEFVCLKNGDMLLNGKKLGSDIEVVKAMRIALGLQDPQDPDLKKIGINTCTPTHDVEIVDNIGCSFLYIDEGKIYLYGNEISADELATILDKGTSALKHEMAAKWYQDAMKKYNIEVREHVQATVKEYKDKCMINEERGEIS